MINQVDFHSHVLPGIDDGSKDTDMSFAMLELEQAQGIETVIATPHFYADRDSVEAFLSRRKQSMERLMQASSREKKSLPQICLGAEVHYFSAIGKASMLHELCVEQTKILLLELPFRQWDDSIYENIERLFEKQGLNIVLAHIERYYGFQRDRHVWKKILQLPVCIQMNAEAFIDWRRRGRNLRILKNSGRVLLGSDAHNLTTRRPNLLEGCEAIEKKLGSEYIVRTRALEEELLRQ